MMKLVVLFTALLTVLTLQTVAFVQGQPITPTAPFGGQPQQSQTEQQQPITAGTPFTQPPRLTRAEIARRNRTISLLAA